MVPRELEHMVLARTPRSHIEINGSGPPAAREERARELYRSRSTYRPLLHLDVLYFDYAPWLSHCLQLLFGRSTLNESPSFLLIYRQHFRYVFSLYASKEKNEALATKKKKINKKGSRVRDGVSEEASPECINLERRKVLESGNVTP